MTPAVPPRRVDALLVLGLTLVAIAMSPLAALIIDSGRDLGSAYAIVRGEAFPAYGPSLFGTWRFGPVWFYLLAMPLAVFGSVTAAAVFAGTLGALKIPLAWVLGRRARDAALGLAAAAFIALPGWTTLGQLVLSHAMLVEAGVVGTLCLCLLATQRDSALLAVWAAVAMALAIHAHPTALVVAPAVAWALWRAVVLPRRWAWLVLAALAFVLPFAPALVAEARAGWPQLAGSATYFGHGDYLARADRIDDILVGATWGQALLVRDFLLARWPPLAWFVFAGSLVVLAVATVGLAVGLVRDKLVPVALSLAAFAWLFVLLLRDATPAWMAYAPLAVTALLLALGWWQAWPARWRGVGARGVAVFALIASGAVLASRVATVRDGVQYLPTASVADIAVPPQRDLPMRFWLPTWAHDAIFARLCATPGAVSLHGDLAAALHFGQGVAAALQCTDATAVGAGGQSPRTLVGVPRVVAESLGIAGEATSWGFVLATPVRVIHPLDAVPFATHARYLMDDYLPRIGRDAPTPVRAHTACRAGDVLVVTDRVPGLNEPFEVRGVERELPALLERTIASRYFACPESGELSLDVVALDAAAVGIVLVGAVPRVDAD